MNWKRAARLCFAATFIALGIVGLVSGGFAPIWLPVRAAFPARQLLADLSALVALTCGGGLLLKRSAAPAALVLFVCLFVWTLIFKVPAIVRTPLVEVTYQSCGESVVLVAAAWLLYVGLATETGRLQNPLSGKAAERIALLLYGLALIAFGLSHFVYLNFTAPLVPKWLPGPVFWAYSTGGIYLLAGLTLVTGFRARWGAVAAAAQIALITLLVWGPVAVSGKMNADSWVETAVSWALTASALVIAASFESAPWFGAPKAV